MAARCDEQVDIDTDHSPFLSATGVVADHLERSGVLVTDMKVRIGFGLGTRTNLNDEAYGTVVDALEAHQFDSLWLSEKISGEAPDPLVAMAFGAGRTTNLKFGMSVMVLPGRNPVVLAKQLATLGRMSGGRLLPAFGLGAVDPIEQQAFGVERSERARIFNESLEVMKKCWTGEPFESSRRLLQL